MNAFTEIGPPMPELTPGDGDEEAADGSGEHGAEREADHRVAVDADAHELRGDPVLGERPHRAARLAVLHEQDEGGDEDDRQGADEEPVVGHDDGVRDENATHDLRHAALLLAEHEQDHRVEEEGDGGGEEHGALLAHAAPDHRAKEELLDERADRGESHAGGEERHGEGQAELPVDVIGHEAAEHVHLAVREVEHVHEREDKRQPERDQRILRAKIEPVRDHLFHGATHWPGGRLATACPEVAGREALSRLRRRTGS